MAKIISKWKPYAFQITQSYFWPNWPVIGCVVVTLFVVTFDFKMRLLRYPAQFHFQFDKLAI